MSETGRTGLELGEAARSRRQELGLSQAELGRRRAMTQSAVARFEGGGTVPTIPVPRPAGPRAGSRPARDMQAAHGHSLKRSFRRGGDPSRVRRSGDPCRPPGSLAHGATRSAAVKEASWSASSKSGGAWKRPPVGGGDPFTRLRKGAGSGSENSAFVSTSVCLSVRGCEGGTGEVPPACWWGPDDC